MGTGDASGGGRMPEATAQRPEPLVAIVEDHQLLAEALAAALAAEGYQVVLPSLTSLGDVARILQSSPPDVALLDLDLGSVGSGEDLLPVITALGTKVIVVSGQNHRAIAGRCLSLGAWAWIPKNVPFETLLSAVMTAAAGEEVMDRSTKDNLLRAWREHRTTLAETMAPFDRLTRREAAVLARIVEGVAAEQIAQESYTSVATVRTQVRAILAKLGVNSQLEAVAKATRAGWSPSEP
jgi:two-component system nitrate/nitrite response regulator NarL